MKFLRFAQIIVAHYHWVMSCKLHSRTDGVGSMPVVLQEPRSLCEKHLYAWTSSALQQLHYSSQSFSKPVPAATHRAAANSERERELLLLLLSLTHILLFGFLAKGTFTDNSSHSTLIVWHIAD